MLNLNTIDYKLRKIIIYNLLKRAFKLKEDLINAYLDSYQNLFLDMAIPEGSLSNPLFFLEDYKKALNSFNYFDDSIISIDEFKFRIPTEDTFVFNGRLNFLQLLLNGVVGIYYELPQNDYDYLINKISGKAFKDYIASLPKFFDEDTEQEYRFYLLDYEESLYKIVTNILQKKLIIFPFSNASPIDIFKEGIDYFENNIDIIINEAINNSINYIKRGTDV